MYSLAKQLIPIPLLRRLRAARGLLNRHSIAEAARRHPSVVLTTDNVVEHYYHFLFDLCLPLHLLLESAPDATFTIDTTGPFLPRLEQLFRNRVVLAGERIASGMAEKRTLLGMNPFLVHVTRPDVSSFAQHVRSAAGVEPSLPRNKILLIERLPTQAFFRTAAVQRGGGASRRHIPNHDDVARTVESLVQSPYEFQNVRLEEISFDEQVRLFARAAVVVGQHGAGLANCLWMASEGTVVELSNDPEKSHFLRLCNALAQRHVLLRTRGAHDPVDIDALRTMLEREIRLDDSPQIT